MAKYCLRACGRLSTAATLIAIGIIQIIVGLILLRSEYVYLLSVPNFWTACANIAVGSLLGISATTWKTIHKKSSKYAARRGLLASLAISVLLLNATTATMFIIDESKELLLIFWDHKSTSSKIFADEIFAYAYATSVCSPIVCVVISIAFLIGICCQSKTVRRKTLNLKDSLDVDNTHIYSWVYTPNLPKADPEVLRAPLSSSDSATSSSESDSDSSLDIPIRHSSDISPDAYRNSRLEISNQSLLQYSDRRRRELKNSVHSMNQKTNRVSSVIGEIGSSMEAPISEKGVHLARSGNFRNMSGKNIENYPPSDSLVACTSVGENTSPVRFMKSCGKPRVLFTEYPSGDSILSTTNLSNLSGKRSFNQYEQEIVQPLDLSLNMHTLSDEVIKELNSLRTTPRESLSIQEEASLSSADTSMDASDHLLVHHGQVRRTSTADHSKVQQELQCLEDSAIYFEPEMRNQNDLTSPSLENMEVSSYEHSNIVDGSAGEESNSFASDVLQTSNRQSNSCKRLPSKLIPVSTPVISDGNRYIVPLKQISPSPGGVKPYSKTKNSYNKYLQTGFSSFKPGKKTDEVDTLKFSKKRNSVVLPSPMTSISEVPTEEVYDSISVLPSTSAGISGYTSASYCRSDDESDLMQSSKQRKYHSLKIEKSDWTDIPLDDNRCTSSQSEIPSSSFGQTNDTKLTGILSKGTPSSLKKNPKNLRISIV